MSRILRLLFIFTFTALIVCNSANNSFACCFSSSVQGLRSTFGSKTLLYRALSCDIDLLLFISSLIFRNSSMPYLFTAAINVLSSSLENSPVNRALLTKEKKTPLSRITFFYSGNFISPFISTLILTSCSNTF
jgi:hypothetical protein